MIIQLPESFQMSSPSSEKGAYIEGEILKLKRDISFRRVMTEITYLLKDGTRCYYCGQEVLEGEMTIDHMYPQEFGGPTIPDNMVPSCKKCNNEKASLNTSQYRAYLKARKDGRAREFRKDIEVYQDFVRKWQGFGIPTEWLSEKDVSDIIVTLNLEEDYKCKKYRKIASYYETYKHFQKPLIVDRNGFLLDGFLALMYAKNNKIKNVPVIQLDNVEVFL